MSQDLTAKSPALLALTTKSSRFITAFVVSSIPAAIKAHQVFDPETTVPFLIVTFTSWVAPEPEMLNLTTEFPVSASNVFPSKSIVKSIALVMFKAFCP